MFDADNGSSEISLESVMDMIDFSVGEYDDILRLKHGICSFLNKTRMKDDATEGLVYIQQTRDPVSIVENKDCESTINLPTRSRHLGFLGLLLGYPRRLKMT